MKKLLAGLAALALAAPALAALPEGAAAPDFEATAAKAGETFDFSLSAALAEGPVVVYFFPKANTKGCDMQAYEFGQRMNEFASLGSTVIGVSADGVDTLKAYSADPETCAGKFAVVSDESGEIMRAYDAELMRDGAPTGVADRASFVVVPGGEIVFAYSDLGEPLKHVDGSLEAVKDWAARRAAAE